MGLLSCLTTSGPQPPTKVVQQGGPAHLQTSESRKWRSLRSQASTLYWNDEGENFTPKTTRTRHHQRFHRRASRRSDHHPNIYKTCHY